jgi:5-methylcytosine-specific restriction endonuclease McrA
VKPTTRGWIQGAAFTPPLFLGLTAWAQTGTVAGPAGAGVAVALAFLTWPLVVGAVVFGLPAVAMGLLTRPSWRAWWRKRRKARGHPRPNVPAWLRRCVMAGGRWRCAACPAWATDADHVMPYSAGGLPTLFNLMGLCEACNTVKSDYWVHRSGWVQYHPWPGHDNRARAADILHAERRARGNPLRWLRALAAL